MSRLDKAFLGGQAIGLCGMLGGMYLAYTFDNFWIFVLSSLVGLVSALGFINLVYKFCKD